MRKPNLGALALVSALVLILASCSGSEGPQGPAGPSGPPGVSTGTIAGAVTATGASGGVPGVAVTTVPDEGVSAVTAGNGSYSLAGLPVGVYKVVFSATGLATVEVPGVSVLAGQTAAVSASMPYSPITLAIKGATATTNVPNPAGFGQAVALTAVASGATGPLGYSWSITAGPFPAGSPPAITPGGDPSTASFTTATFADVAASGAVTRPPLQVEPRAGFVAISPGQLAQMSYTVRVVASDGSYTQTATAAVSPAMLTPGVPNFAATGVLVIANEGSAVTTFNWKLTNPLGGDATSQLSFPTTRNPMFVPATEGLWTLTNGSTTLPVQVGKYVGLGKFVDALANGVGRCSQCHFGSSGTPALAAALSLVTDWKNSAHGNHYFRYMTYDGTKYVLKPGVSGNVLPTDGGPNWPALNSVTSQPNAMTLLQWGLSRGSGSHYSGSCISCHTTGYVANSSGANGGFDDVMASNNASAGLPWAFPRLADPVPAQPDPAAWDAMPADLKALAGMQCESCHGPMSQHANNVTAPAFKARAFFGGDSCAFCHNRPPKHDRHYLWAMSAHANLLTAIDEAAVSATRAATYDNAAAAGTNPFSAGAGHCGRCHSAQGFVSWLPEQQAGSCADQAYPSGFVHATTCYLDYAQAQPGITACTTGKCSLTAYDSFLSGLGLTKAQVQPETCQACHDPHTTELRVWGDSGALPGGYSVSSVGSGAICFVCHNSRNGAHGDAFPLAPGTTNIGAPHASAQGDVVAGRNAYFVGAMPSKHLTFVADACVGCHMTLGWDAKTEVGAASADGYVPSGTNHYFKVDTKICARCHGEAIAEGVEFSYASGLGALDQAAIDRFLQTLPASFDVKGSYTSGSSTVDKYVTVQKSNIAAVTAFAGSSSGPRFSLVLAAPINDPNAASGTVSTLNVATPNLFQVGSTTVRVYASAGIFQKAGWNRQLVVGDMSKGVHNPSFVSDVLQATAAQLRAAAPGAL